ncbi:LysR family transcriptional regulator [Brooklawnia cerclae]|uniref:DNA-binding transcriptional LysR family regulator n=1 Tax=Brooklawnia cerclae TaxID=349934 RepID=A0ABX0SHY6_9ACTN|nr:DNA-binding transcriptional LysR family regulator [Brooklawnia cerclae]
MLDLHRLRLLVELERRGTLSAVADALSYSKSTVSQQLGALEREAGVSLIQPSGRKVQLTPQGRVLAGYGRRLLDVLDEAEAEVARTVTAVSGTIRIAVFQSASYAIVPTALSLLAERHPGLRVEVVTRGPEEGLVEVSSRDFDLVLAEQYPGRTRPLFTNLDRVALTRDPIRLAVPPRPASPALPGTTATDDPPRLADLRDALWVMEPIGTAARDWSVQVCRSAGFEPDVRFETADLMAHVRLIESGNAVGLLPDLVWAGQRPTVSLTELPGAPRREVFSSARRSAAAHPAVGAARRALAEAVLAASVPGLTPGPS